MNKQEFNAYKYFFLQYCRRCNEAQRFLNPATVGDWNVWTGSLDFSISADDTLRLSWTQPRIGHMDLNTAGLKWFNRDPEEQSREEYIHRTIIEHVHQSARAAGLDLHKDNSPEAIIEGRFHRHFLEEESLFDNWALEVNPAKIDVRQMNESLTAPEMRYITGLLGDLNGKTLLDIGCGLGEASVYFATKGALVTAVDLSREMLVKVQELAAWNQVSVETHQAMAEHLHFPACRKFDIIYAGNVFHHVDIRAVLTEVVNHLAPGGKLVCWEPVAYNPVINIYRKIANQVRSDDERPITHSDIAIFRSHFSDVKIEWFWLTTLLIFVLMYFIQRRNPNVERYWKAVVTEEDRWAWLYRPLEKFDRFLIKIFPSLGMLCWNVVICAKEPKHRV